MKPHPACQETSRLPEACPPTYSTNVPHTAHFQSIDQLSHHVFADCLFCLRGKMILHSLRAADPLDRDRHDGGNRGHSPNLKEQFSFASIYLIPIHQCGCDVMVLSIQIQNDRP